MRATVGRRTLGRLLQRTNARRAGLKPLIGFCVLLSLGALAVWLWGFDGHIHMRHWALEGQRQAQNAMAGTVRALRAGEPGAILSLCAVTFAYGVFHAVGPGHGKIVLGGYGLARRVTLLRLVGLSFLASLAQAGTAIGLVVITALLLGWGRLEMTTAAEDWLAPLSYGLMAVVGLYLVIRGLRRLAATRPGPGARHDHEATPDDEGVCSSCGHRHGPSLKEVEAATSWRENLVLIAAIAMRPCTGAIFLLLVTWRMGLLEAGILGALTMGLGTAMVTAGVAALSVLLRRGMIPTPDAEASPHVTSVRIPLAALAAVIEILAGAMIAVLCLQLMWPLI